jgi:hypothetical protein
MKPFHLMLVLSSIVLGKCDERNAAPHQVSRAPVLSVILPDTVQLGHEVSFETTCSVPTPCWRFKQFEIHQTTKQYSIIPLTEYGGEPCIQVIGSLKARSSVRPSERGTYTFRFWRAQQDTLDMIVVVR